MPNFLDIALKYHSMGFNVVPVSEHKHPTQAWARYQVERQTEKEVQQLFTKEAHGIAIITGFNGLECIDIDVKNDPDGTIWQELEAELTREPYNAIVDYAVQRTPSGGAHLLYRLTTDVPPNNSRLARKLGRAIIETRGQGGLVVVHPTAGYTLTNEQYLSSCLLPEERSALIELCATFNEEMPEKQAEPRVIKDYATTDTEEKPWLKFNREHGRDFVLGILENHGWQIVREKGPRTFLRRPGKDVGVSGDYHSEQNLFKVFTTSTEFSPDTAYSPFAVVTLLEYGGDYGAALRGLGLNDRAAGSPARSEYSNTPVKPDSSTMPKTEAELQARWPDVYFYDPDDDEEDEDWSITFRTNSNTYGVAGPGMIISLAGHEKSRKSTFLYTLIMGGLIGQPLLGFQWEKPIRKILVFDTEQARKWIKRAGNMIKRVSPASNWKEKVEIFGLKKISDAQRLDFIKERIYLCGPDLDLIIIDGIADLCNDFNDLGKSKAVIEQLMNLHPTAALAGVIHLNKGNGEERGHLGAIFKQKSDVILRVTYDDDTKVSKLRCYRSRDIPFPDVEFTQDKAGNVILASSEVTDSYIDL